MKKLMTFALVCAAAAMAAITFTACGDNGGDPPAVPVITIGTQPTSPAAMTEGAVTGTLTVTATATEGAALMYQWYSNTVANNTGGTAISGATAASYTLSATLTAGTYYYFCEVGATGAKAVRTNTVTVTVNEAEEPVDNARLIGKWDAAANTLGIVSVEFGVSGNHIVVADGELATRAEDEDELVVYFGTYTIDGGRVALSDLGTMTVKSLDGNAISFTLDTGGSGGAVEIGAAKAQEMPASDKTDMLCRTWKMVDYESTYPNEDEDDTAHVYFSKAGTYLVSYSDGTSGVSSWKWKSEADGVLYYSWETPPEWFDDETTTVETLTATSLVIYEQMDDDLNGDGVDETYEYRWSFEPVPAPAATRSGGFPAASLLGGASGRSFLGR